MAQKEKLKGGLANLLSGADQSVSRQKEQEPAPQMVTEPAAQKDGIDLIGSIEDEELREELERRLIQKRKKKVGRPRKNDQLGKPTKEGYDRTSLIVNVAKWAKVKEIALRETLTLKEILEAALDMVIERYESKHGEVKPQQRTKKDINEIF